MSSCILDINMYRVATVLCEIAENEKIKPCEPDIHLFEELFLKSVEKYGRAKELKVVMNFNLRTLRPFKDLGQGLSLMLKGAINPKEMFKKSPPDKRIARIFSRVQEIGAG